VFDLSARRALVTGGAQGLGAAIAECLARAGAAVTIGDCDVPRAIATAAELADAIAADVTAFPLDVGQTESVNACIAHVVAGGGLDILVNNAAIYPSDTWADPNDEQWQQVLNVNVHGVHRCVRAAGRHLTAHGRGRVINLASTTVHLGWPSLLSYTASKGAVMAITRTLARELGPLGCTVNAVVPGAFPTRSEQQTQADATGFGAWIVDQQSIKRRGVGSDVGNAAVYFASDEAAFITGQCLQVDGGWVMR